MTSPKSIREKIEEWARQSGYYQLGKEEREKATEEWLMKLKKIPKERPRGLQYLRRVREGRR